MLVVFVVCPVLWLGWSKLVSVVVKKDERARALSGYASRFELIDARCLNDLTLSLLLDSVNRKWGRLYLTGDAHFIMCLESFVAIRDRVDELEGRYSGHGNRLNIRNTITAAILDLSERTAYFDQLDMIRPFRVWQEIPDEHLGYFISYTDEMEQIYMGHG